MLDYHRRQARTAVRDGRDNWSLEKHRGAGLKKQVAGLAEEVARLEGSEADRSAELAQNRLEVEALKAEKERLEKARADLDELSRQEWLRSEGAWSRKVRDTKAGMLLAFKGRLDKVLKYIEDQARVMPVVALLNRATAVLDSYTSLIDIGIEVPSAQVEKCRSEIEEFSRKIESEDVTTSDELDLDFKALQDLVAAMDHGTPGQYPQP